MVKEKCMQMSMHFCFRHQAATVSEVTRAPPTSLAIGTVRKLLDVSPGLMWGWGQSPCCAKQSRLA